MPRSHIYVVQSCAMSLDGYIDDTSNNRLLLSNTEDFDQVDELRATCDAILVGAETLRVDNPRLIIRSEERRAARIARGLPADIAKVTITKSGNISPNLRFFTTGDCSKIVYCPDSCCARVKAALSDLATVVCTGSHKVDLRRLLQDLEARGFRRLLIEGGSHVHTLFLEAGLVDELRLAIASFFVGNEHAPRFVQPGTFPHNAARRATLIDCSSVGDMAVLRYSFKER
ncbi:dihydrofolate reductase family protein [Patescibacteria group bacterium]|nr:dihydrofolate reductase family protein [Patescibacteria group bacterium]